MLTLDERDGHFRDPAARANALPQEFDEEGIAVRGQPMQREAGQRVTPPAAKPAGAVAHGHTGDRSDVAIGMAAEENTP